MIIGNGLLANIFNSYDNNDIIIFASGVSNSYETNEDEYKREFDLLKKFINTELKLIYFSTVSINNDRRYFKHKQDIEIFIKDNFKNYIIFRLPNIIGNGGNKNNIFNSFKYKIINKEPIIIYNIYKSFIDIEDIRNICLECLIYNNIVLNISYIEKIKIYDFINFMMNELNSFTKITINYDYNEKILDNSIEINNTINKLNISSHEYTKNLVKKYININKL